jgi:hypothetical protein
MPYDGYGALKALVADPVLIEDAHGSAVQPGSASPGPTCETTATARLRQRAEQRRRDVAIRPKRSRSSAP